ncbi:MAG TPA: IS110 family transposase [Anaerolineales bacterium]|nr:IS110 family transposase [Anaerolineales bacterium]
MAERTSQTNVGIDVSKEWLDIVVLPSGESWRTENQEEAICELIKTLEPLMPERIVVEATGGYEQMLVVQLYLAGLPLCRVNPKRTRYFARSLGQIAKTDKLDGKVLALFGERVKPPLTRLPSEKEQVLSALITRREQISNFLVSERNRLHTAPKNLHASLNEHITWLKNQLKQLERDIDQFVNNDPDFKEKSELLVEVQGVGKKTAAKLIADVPELGDCDRKQIAALVGVAPYSRDSGRKRGQRFISGGRPDVRSILYMATLTATRCNPVIRKMYQRLLKVGKKKKVALVACMRKLLTILNAILRDRSHWNLAFSS